MASARLWFPRIKAAFSFIEPLLFFFLIEDLSDGSLDERDTCFFYLCVVFSPVDKFISSVLGTGEYTMHFTSDIIYL